MLDSLSTHKTLNTSNRMQTVSGQTKCQTITIITIPFKSGCFRIHFNQTSLLKKETLLLVNKSIKSFEPNLGHRQKYFGPVEKGMLDTHTHIYIYILHIQLYIQSCKKIRVYIILYTSVYTWNHMYISTCSLCKFDISPTPFSRVQITAPEKRQCCLAWVDSQSLLKSSLKSHHKRDTVGSSLEYHFLMLIFWEVSVQ